jgi:hypothetical protein
MGLGLMLGLTGYWMDAGPIFQAKGMGSGGKPF